MASRDKQRRDADRRSGRQDAPRDKATMAVCVSSAAVATAARQAPSDRERMLEDPERWDGMS